MGFHWVKVLPTASPQENTQQSSVKASPVTTVYHWITQHWHQSQIGHRSEYSVERLLAFRDYHQRTSLARAIAVCVLTPIPSVLVALLIDCTPLNPPSDGWRANSTFFLRWSVASFFVAMGATAQLREVILPGALSTSGSVAIAFTTATMHTSMVIAVAATWKFPIPFGYVLLVGPFMMIFWSITFLVIGLRVLANSQVLRQQIRTQFMIVAAHGFVSIAYPVSTAVFYRLPGVQQVAFLFVMPVIKHLTKQMIVTAAMNRHEYVAQIVVFSVDLFHVFYVAICMQTAKSPIATVIMMTSDTFHVIIAVRAIFHQANVFRKRQPELSSEVRAQQLLHSLEDLPGMVRKVFADPEILHRDSRIRVFAPSSLPLSDDSICFVNEITRSRRDAHVYVSARLHAWNPAVEMTSSVSYRSKFRAVFTSQHVVRSGQLPENSAAPAQVLHDPLAPSSSNQTHPAKPSISRKESTPRRLLTLMHSDAAISSGRLRSTLSQQADEEALWDILQALFHSEYLLMTEYIEFALPTLYAAYLAAIFHLPVASYYPQTASLSPEGLSRTVATIMANAAIELVGFVGLLLLLRRKFGLSPLRQLAFAFETQAWALQGHLFVWTIYILHLRLMHYGVDFDADL